MKKLWIIVISVVIIGAGAYYWLSRNSSDKISYQLGKVDRGDISVNISATGSLQAVTTVQVGSQITGTIARLYADFNSVVTEGQLLAQLDPTFLQASVREQQANVDKAQAQVNEAERNLKRTSDLFSKSMVAQTDMDAVTTSLESARADLRQAQASLQRAEVNLRYATIRAPISGLVISRNVDVGQTVAASLQAPTLFTIANDLRKMQVQADVDEADIGSVKVGQPVTFRVDAYPDDEFDGQVSQIRMAPVVNQNVVTYNVIIDVTNPELKLMPGMTATIAIEVSRMENILRIPLQALHFTPSDSGRMLMNTGGATPASGDKTGMGNSLPHNKNRARLWVLENGRPSPRYIIRGIQNTRYAEAKESDLKEGDEVIISAGTEKTQAATAQGQNPFMPRMGPGGGRGPGR